MLFTSEAELFSDQSTLFYLLILLKICCGVLVKIPPVVVTIFDLN
jgi:hypothetical protein